MILGWTVWVQDSEIPVVRLPARSAWGLLCRALLEVSEAGPDQPDWVLITTEDTFALPENLRYYVAPLNASEPHYLGHAMKFWSQVNSITYEIDHYMS